MFACCRKTLQQQQIQPSNDELAALVDSVFQLRDTGKINAVHWLAVMAEACRMLAELVRLLHPNLKKMKKVKIYIKTKRFVVNFMKWLRTWQHSKKRSKTSNVHLIFCV